MTQHERYTLALPSKGALADPTVAFLRESGLRLHKPNPRQYTGTLTNVPNMDVLFQRVKDVLYKVADGTVQLGITGLDVVHEHPDDDVLVLHNALGYGHCALTVAVPEAWVDVETMLDLTEVALDLRAQQQRSLRVATTYPHLTRQFLHQHGIHHFTIVKAEGAIEAAPTLGYADAIVDLAQTGTTLRENHLKPLPDGVIVASQAVLVGNRRALAHNATLLSAVRVLLETVDAHLVGRRYMQLTCNIQGHDEESVAQRVVANPITRGLQGPTIARIYQPSNGGTQGNQWFTVSLIIHADQLLEAVDHLRAIGGAQTTAIPARYVFLPASPSFTALCEVLARQPSA